MLCDLLALARSSAGCGAECLDSSLAPNSSLRRSDLFLPWKPRGKSTWTSICWGFVGLEGCRCWSFTIFFSVGGCLGAPKVMHGPHRGLRPGAAVEAAGPPQAARPPSAQPLRQRQPEPPAGPSPDRATLTLSGLRDLPRLPATQRHPGLFISCI